MNFERLKLFYFVFKCGSIQKAADELNVTRSAVSQSLKLLEEELKVVLFLRNSKSFVPTPEAEQLYTAVAPLVTELSDTLKRIDLGLNRPSGHLKIGAPADFGSGNLTRIIGKFRKKFPEVTFELHLAVPIKQLEMLSAGQLDLAFIDNGDVHAQNYPVKIQTVMKEEFVLTVSDRNYVKFNLSKNTRENLLKIPFVDYLPHAPVAKMWFRHHFGKAIEDLNIVFSAESVRSVLTAIQEDIGVGVVPRHLVTGEFKNLKVVEMPRGSFMNQIMLATPIGRTQSSRLTEFKKFYLDQSRKV